MNQYDKDMMHNRELIYDAKKQKEYHPGDTKHDDELIYDAKGEIHRIDEQKHEAHGYSSSAHKIIKHSRKNRS